MTEPSPRLVMVAGPNGSGKSTLIDALRASPIIDLPAHYINADNLRRERDLIDPREAQRIATAMRQDAILRRLDVMYETVMSHPSKLAELQQAKAAGYHVTVHLVGTSDPEINVQRIAMRVAAGGHDVPEDRTRERYGRTMAFAPIAIGYADQASVFDNSSRGDACGGLLEQASLVNGELLLTTTAPAQWVCKLIEQVNERGSELRAFADGGQAGGIPPQLARIDNGRTSGPMVLIGKHYALQYDELSGSPVLHDRILLGKLAEKLVARQSFDISYREGVAVPMP
jgi:predicted ABC-type ATPase